MKETSDRFFFGVKKGGNVYGEEPGTFFTKQHIGRHTFMNIVKRVYATVGLRGDGADNVVTTHGLRAKMVSLLINAGFDDSTITLRTGHRNIASLRNYHNLRGEIELE